jgi:UDP-N-acetylglucosamine--N-acetylmuramyl-(pentapeptide) pyrophosphoryl-undecaprenol N-acetylglucosamine transferase
MMKRVLFAGGGTGGHIFMAVALARELEKRQPGVEVLFVGARRGMGKDIVPALGFPFQTLNIGGFKGVGLFRAALTLLQIPGSLLSSRRMIRDFSPSIIVGLGGYSSGPIMLAGRALGFPGLLIEPNVQPGFTNRVLKHWVDAAAVAFEETAQWFGNKARLTGIPVRQEFHQLSPKISRGGPLCLLVFGGSQGSTPINQLVCEALPFLPPTGEIEIVHQTGLSDHFAVKERYQQAGWKAEVIDFIQDMPAYFARADLILSRAGASSVAEISAAGRPSILIPLPHAADDHQRINARALVQKRAALSLEEGETTGEDLAALLTELAQNRDRLAQMAQASRELAHPESRTKIIELMEELTGSRDHA